MLQGWRPSSMRRTHALTPEHSRTSSSSCALRARAVNRLDGLTAGSGAQGSGGGWPNSPETGLARGHGAWPARKCRARRPGPPRWDPPPAVRAALKSWRCRPARPSPYVSTAIMTLEALITA